MNYNQLLCLLALMILLKRMIRFYVAYFIFLFKKNNKNDYKSDYTKPKKTFRKNQIVFSFF